MFGIPKDDEFYIDIDEALAKIDQIRLEQLQVLKQIENTYHYLQLLKMCGRTRVTLKQLGESGVDAN